ncbi:MAG: Zeta toxin family protein [Planctomycetes bacterium B3_Pla]|nr:MAG: Zeta toxin family protein [Planctomycetes bacterium B3_Pla]
MNNGNVYIIAGPNGSGKTTFAVKFLPEYARCPNFVNADLIAQGLSPFSPSAAAITAGKLVLEQIHQFADKGVDFAFETTLSGQLYVNLFKSLKEKGYKIHLFFLWIPDTDLAISRIKSRVAQGGHDVPVQDVLRRFSRSISNFFKLYQSLADSWLLFDNAGVNPILIAECKHGKVKITNESSYNTIVQGIGGT